MKSIETAQLEKPALTDLVNVDPEDHSKAVKALAAAQEEIAGLKDRHREERLAWIVVVVLVFDCFLFLDADNWSGPIVIGLLEIGALSVVAARLGVEEFAALFKGALFRITDLMVNKE